MIDTRETINVEDHPDIDPSTDEGKEELAAVAFHLSRGRSSAHFVFRRKGEEIGEIFLKSPFDRPQ